MTETDAPASPVPRKRLAWIDAAKGLGIMLVVLIHVAGVGWATIFVLPFFFFLSGISSAFSRQEGFMGRRVRGLLTPYFVFSVLSFLYWALLERHYRPPTAIGAVDVFFNIFYAGGGNKFIFNAPIWFLPCLFTLETGFYVMRRAFSSSGTRILLLILCTLAGFALGGIAPFSPAFKLPFRLPWMLDTALLAAIFYAIGLALGKRRSLLEKATVSPSWLLMVACAGLLCVFFPGANDMAELVLPHPIKFYGVSLAGTASVCALAMLFPAAWLCMLGRNSLTIMCVHDPLKRLVIKGASVLSGMDPLALRQWTPSIIAISAAILALSMLLATLINNYFPWVTKGAPLPDALRRLVTDGQKKH